VEARLVEGCLALVERERRGEAINRGLLGRLVRALADLGRYSATWEPSFLSTSAAWYQGEGQERLGAMDVPSYLEHCEVGGRGREGGRGGGALGGACVDGDSGVAEVYLQLATPATYL
jgi:hypothetical protein